VKNWLQKVFGGKSQSEFESDVLNILQSSFPDASFKLESDSFAIVAGQMQFSLKELKQKLRSSEAIQPQIAQHFMPLLGAKPMVAEQSVNADQVSSKIMPWFVPSLNVTQNEWLLTPFHHGISIGYCVENEAFRTPIDNAFLKKWNVSQREIHETSILNLKTFRNLKLEVEGPEPFIGIELKDGHDAVRLLLSDVREFAASKLGEPFYAGTPSRDFLILWSKNCSPRFHEFVQEKIDDDFHSQPFPLTKSKFQATRYSVDPA
jgi:hypothetical protein